MVIIRQQKGSKTDGEGINGGEGGWMAYRRSAGVPEPRTLPPDHLSPGWLYGRYGHKGTGGMGRGVGEVKGGGQSTPFQAPGFLRNFSPLHCSTPYRPKYHSSMWVCVRACMHACMCVDGWMDGWMDVRTDGLRDGYTCGGGGEEELCL